MGDHDTQGEADSHKNKPVEQQLVLFDPEKMPELRDNGDGTVSIPETGQTYQVKYV